MTSATTGNRTVSYVYDSSGNLLSATDPRGLTTSYEYDAVNRVTAVHRPDGKDVYFEYDANGNMRVLTAPSAVDHGFDYGPTGLNTAHQAVEKWRSAASTKKSRPLMYA